MNFSIRPMEEKDLLITFQWRNEPDVVKTAMTVDIISYKEHEAMFKFNNSIKLVFEVNGHPAGYVQVSRDPDENKGEWAFHMGKKHKGKGLSTIMLKIALYYLINVEGYTEVYAKVKPDNALSQGLHTKLSFTYTGKDKDLFTYSKKLCSS